MTLREDYLDFAEKRGMANDDAKMELDHWIRYGNTNFNARTQRLLRDFVKERLK